ncbi:Protein pim1 [Paramyrothecium foliicola]|nr:Protein pim1 [Paramyrothecium foliicola]
MPPKAKAAAAAKAAPAKAAPARKASGAATAKRDAKPAAKSAEKKEALKPLTNGAARKRKAEETDEEPAEQDEVPKPKKSKTAAKPVAPRATKPKPTKKAKVEKDEDVTEPEEEEEAKPAASAEPEPKRKSKEATPAAEKKKPAPVAKKAPSIAIGKKINQAPTQILDVYVFGEGSSGELGLGSKRVNGKKPIDVKRPRLNENLSADKVGVVQLACGGMHAVALTRDNRILTWGVNDQGALGRDTTWDGGLRDMDDDEDSDDDDEDTGINPHESTPTAVSDEYFASGTKFVQVAASDSASFVLTEDGRVYGWGTFRSSDGILGFTETIKVQATPMLLPNLKNIKSLATGSNHVLALDHKGNVVAWGCGQQNQLGRRIIERNKMSSLIPQGIGLPRGKIVQIACGSYHSFAIDKEGQVYGWGLNNFGEVGVESNAGEDEAVILKPAKISAFEDLKISHIDGGEHHSLACSDKGELFTWGRVDGYQVGFEFDALTEENTIYDERKTPRILFKPIVNDGLLFQPDCFVFLYLLVIDVEDVVAVAAGTDNSFAVTRDGKVYSWGFSSNYQTGQGTIDDIHVPTLIDNTAIREKKIVGAGAGGQFSALVGKSEDTKMSNGV